MLYPAPHLVDGVEAEPDDMERVQHPGRLNPRPLDPQGRGFGRSAPNSAIRHCPALSARSVRSGGIGGSPNFALVPAWSRNWPDVRRSTDHRHGRLERTFQPPCNIRVAVDETVWMTANARRPAPQDDEAEPG